MAYHGLSMIRNQHLIMKKISISLVLLLLCQLLISQNIQHSGNFSGTIIKQVSADYLLYLPDGYSPESREVWPLLVFLHGSGERGTDLEKLKVHGPPKLIEQGQKFPFIVLSPQCPNNQDFDTETLFSLIEHITKEYNVDKDRIVVTGLSMGGGATWDLAFAYPGYFAAIVPVCGVVDRNYPSRVAEIKDQPVWVFHGANDFIVPIVQSAGIVNALKELGSNIKFTIYPTAGHDSWTETYNNPELYEWLLQQRRK